MKKKDTEFSWVQLVEKSDPSIRTRPVVTYTFDNGNRVFYKGRKKSGYRKS
jgi:hypothetical protein